MHGHWLKNILGGGSGGSGSGSGEGPLIVTLSGESLVANKTFGEIYDAFEAGRVVRVEFSSEDGLKGLGQIERARYAPPYNDFAEEYTLTGVITNPLTNELKNLESQNNPTAVATDFPYFVGGSPK